MTIKIFTASIAEFDQIPAIEHWNVAGVRCPQNKNNNEDDNHNNYVVNGLNDCLETTFQMN